MLAHELTPGDAGSAPLRWPRGASMPGPHGRPTLLMFLHPRCPCSQASVRQLARLLAPRGGSVTAHAVFVRPTGRPDRLQDGLRSAVAAIPGVRVWDDPDGREAGRFGVLTSGHTLLYSAGGDLVFSGGLTASRGHDGDSAGRTRLAARLDGATAPGDQASVFGCPLREGVRP